MAIKDYSNITITLGDPVEEIADSLIEAATSREGKQLVYDLHRAVDTCLDFMDGRYDPDFDIEH